MLILSEPALLSLSVTEAVIVWVPAVNVLTSMEPPLPSEPSRLDVQAIAAVRVVSSSSTSVAVAVKLMLVPMA